MAAIERRIDHRRMLRDLVAAIQQARNQKLARVRISQNDPRALADWNQTKEIAPLLFSDRKCFPDFGRRWFGDFRRWPSLNDVGIVNRPTTGHSLTFAASSTTTTAAAGNVADTEDWSLEAIDRKRVTVAVSNRTR